MSEKLSQQIAFIYELEKLKSTYRQTWLQHDNNRYENSAEHSWQVALSANILSEYAIVDIDISRVTKMLLVHDIVEIYAGDTFAFADDSILDTQKQNELESLNRLVNLLPDEQGDDLKKLWLEFESATTNDARFANAIDTMSPALQSLSDNSDGGTWRKFKISRDKILKRNHHVNAVAPKLYEYILAKIDEKFDGDYIR